MNRLYLGLAALLVAPSAATAAPPPVQKIDRVVPLVQVPGAKALAQRRLSCFLTPRANGNSTPTIRNVGLSTYGAGSHIVLLADDTLFIQFDLPADLRRGQTFAPEMEYRSTAKVCVAANIQVNLVAEPTRP